MYKLENNCLLASTVHAVKPIINFTDDFFACAKSYCSVLKNHETC